MEACACLLLYRMPVMEVALPRILSIVYTVACSQVAERKCKGLFARCARKPSPRQGELWQPMQAGARPASPLARVQDANGARQCQRTWPTGKDTGPATYALVTSSPCLVCR